MYNTEQEHFWAGEFGDDYIKRNQGEQLLASNLNFFTKALSQARNVSSCMEFGASIGMNLKALSLLYPAMNFQAIEINVTLPQYLEDNPHLRISFLNIDVDIYEPTKTCLDLLFDRVVKGGVILLDDYVSIFPGANKAVEEFLKDKDYTPKRLPFSVTPCYIIK